MTNLPDKPSALIRLALADLRKCEADPAYEIDMDAYHQPEHGKCVVCLAGAVMACDLDVSRFRVFAPASFERSIAMKLIALNQFRTGDVTCGLNVLKLPDNTIAPPNLDRCVTPYDVDQEMFYMDMAKLADDLEKAGL